MGRPIVGDAQEDVRVVEMPVNEFDRLVLAGDIIDPPLLIARFIAAAKGLLPPL